MRRILICSGVLGGGTVLVFAAAAAASLLIPAGRIVPQNPNVLMERAMPARLGAPVMTGPGFAVDMGTDIAVDVPGREATP